LSPRRDIEKFRNHGLKNFEIKKIAPVGGLKVPGHEGSPIDKNVGTKYRGFGGSCLGYDP